jgi:small subunit ribosomal protein S5
MAELIDETSSIESTTVGVYRTSTTTSGGRRFSFSALVVVGDKAGKVGIGYAKSNQVPLAVEKAQKEARRKMAAYPVLRNTIPHIVEGRFGASKVRLVPATPGTGVIAGAAVRAILEMLGIQDCLTKSYGSTNPKNLVKATLTALSQLQMREKMESLRGVSIGQTMVEAAVERGLAAMPQVRTGEKMQAPKNTVGDERRRGGRGGPRGGGGGGGRRFDEPAPAPSVPAAAAPEAPASAPAPEAPQA